MATLRVERRATRTRVCTRTLSDFAPRIRQELRRRSARIVEIPNLLEIQKDSPSIASSRPGVEHGEARERIGLQAVFQTPCSRSRTSTTRHRWSSSAYTLEHPKYDVQECLQRGMTYAAPFKVTIRLVAWDDAGGSRRRSAT